MCPTSLDKCKKARIPLFNLLKYLEIELGIRVLEHQEEEHELGIEKFMRSF